MADVIPRPVKENRNLAGFWSYAKAYHPSWEPRRLHIRAEFAPLSQRLEEQARRPPPNGQDSSRWMGRRSATVQAKIVISLVPAAVSGLEDLIERLEYPFHNGGPRDSDVDAALEALREIYREIGQLLTLAEAGAAIEDRLNAIRALGRSAFVWSTETFGLTIKGLALSATTTTLACGVSKLLTVIAGMPSPEAVAIGAAAAAANVAVVAKQKSAQDSGR